MPCDRRKRVPVVACGSSSGRVSSPPFTVVDVSW